MKGTTKPLRPPSFRLDSEPGHDIPKSSSPQTAQTHNDSASHAISGVNYLFDAVLLVEPSSAGRSGGNVNVLWSYIGDSSCAEVDSMKALSKFDLDIATLDQFCFPDADELRGRQYAKSSVKAGQSLSGAKKLSSRSVSRLMQQYEIQQEVHQLSNMKGFAPTSYFGSPGHKVYDKQSTDTSLSGSGNSFDGQSELHVFTIGGGEDKGIGISLRCFSPELTQLNIEHTPFSARSFAYLSRPRCCYVLIARYAFAGPDVAPIAFEKCKQVLYTVHGMSVFAHARPSNTSRLLHEDAFKYLKSVQTLRPNEIGAPLSAEALKGYMPIVPNTSAPLLPLLESLGVKGFLSLLSAVLTERRVLIVSDHLPKLAQAAFAVRSMLNLRGEGCPSAVLDWHHVFIPVLPTSLLSMLDAPLPFIIGLKRYLLSKVDDGDTAFQDRDEEYSQAADGRVRRAATEEAGESPYGANLTGVVFVDIDNGVVQTIADKQIGSSTKHSTSASSASATMTSAGIGDVLDIIGDSDSVATLAAENMARLGNFMTKGEESGPVRKDVVKAMMIELRALLSYRPDGEYSENSCSNDSMKTGLGGTVGTGMGTLLSGLTSGGRSNIGDVWRSFAGSTSGEDSGSGNSGDNKFKYSSRLDWLTRGEKILRDQILLFYLYLFGDFGDFALWPAVEAMYQKLIQGKKSPRNITSADNKCLFTDGDARNCFDVPAFLAWKSSKTISLPLQLQALLKEFIHTQAFAQFCTDRALQLYSMRLSASHMIASTSTFDRALVHLRGAAASAAKQPVTISSAKLAISAASSTSGSVSPTTSAGTAVTSCELGKALVHWPTFNYTENDVAESSPVSAASTIAEVTALDKLCEFARETYSLPLIISTLFARVYNCQLASANGVIGRKGHRALKALHYMLLVLPEIPAAQLVGRMIGHLLPVLNAILEVKPTQHSYLDSRIGDVLFNGGLHSALEGFLCLHRDRLVDRASLQAPASLDAASSASLLPPAKSSTDLAPSDLATSLSVPNVTGVSRSTHSNVHSVVKNRINVSSSGTSDRCKMQCIALILLLLDPQLLVGRRKVVQSMRFVASNRTTTSGDPRLTFAQYVGNTVLAFHSIDGYVDGAYGMPGSTHGSTHLASGVPNAVLVDPFESVHAKYTPSAFKGNQAHLAQATVRFKQTGKRTLSAVGPAHVSQQPLAAAASIAKSPMDAWSVSNGGFQAFDPFSGGFSASTGSNTFASFTDPFGDGAFTTDSFGASSSGDAWFASPPSGDPFASPGLAKRATEMAPEWATGSMSYSPKSIEKPHGGSMQMLNPSATEERDATISANSSTGVDRRRLALFYRKHSTGILKGGAGVDLEHRGTGNWDIFAPRNQGKDDAAPVGDADSVTTIESQLSVSDKMLLLYSAFNTSKIKDVPLLLQKYSGQEAVMLARLEERYFPLMREPDLSRAQNIPVSADTADVPLTNSQRPGSIKLYFSPTAAKPAAEDAAASTLQVSAPSASSAFSGASTDADKSSTASVAALIVQIYERHDPSKVSGVPALLAKYPGKELEILHKLQIRYDVQHSGTEVLKAPSTASMANGNPHGQSELALGSISDSFSDPFAATVPAFRSADPFATSASGAMSSSVDGSNAVSGGLLDLLAGLPPPELGTVANTRSVNGISSRQQPVMLGLTAGHVLSSGSNSGIAISSMNLTGVSTVAERRDLSTQSKALKAGDPFAALLPANMGAKRGAI